MPTASSAQTRRRPISIAAHRAMRYFVWVTFRNTRSTIKPVPISRAPATTKSDKVQCTSSVNCMANNGMSNSDDTATRIIPSLLFCMNITFGFGIQS